MKDVENLPMLEVMEIAKKAEQHKQRDRIIASRYYLKKTARQKGITVEEYLQTKVETRGRKRIYFPDGLPSENLEKITEKN